MDHLKADWWAVLMAESTVEKLVDSSVVYSVVLLAVVTVVQLADLWAGGLVDKSAAW